MTTIEWTDRTWNPIVGCSRASAGCDHCYAAGVANRAMQAAHKGLTVATEDGPAFNGTVRCLPERLDEPLRWRKPQLVFVNSMSDVFNREVTEEFIGSVWRTMAIAERHSFQLLTKRPQRMAAVLAKWAGQTEGSGYGGPSWRDHHLLWNESRVWPLPNLWNGTSIENDPNTYRADHLRATPAAVRFLSLEPLLGPLPSLDLTGIDWVIVGGESGGKARPMRPEWVADIRDRCAAAGIPFFMKQAGRVLAKQWGMGEAKGKHLDEMPAEFRIRQWPHGFDRATNTMSERKGAAA